jgi:hypothetical protein
MAKEPEGGYSSCFPDGDGAASQAPTLNVMAPALWAASVSPLRHKALLGQDREAARPNFRPACEGPKRSGVSNVLCDNFGWAALICATAEAQFSSHDNPSSWRLGLRYAACGIVAYDAQINAKA